MIHTYQKIKKEKSPMVKITFLRWPYTKTCCNQSSFWSARLTRSLSEYCWDLFSSAMAVHSGTIAPLKLLPGGVGAQGGGCVSPPSHGRSAVGAGAHGTARCSAMCPHGSFHFSRPVAVTLRFPASIFPFLCCAHFVLSQQFERAAAGR